MLICDKSTKFKWKVVKSNYIDNYKIQKVIKQPKHYEVHHGDDKIEVTMMKNLSNQAKEALENYLKFKN